MGKVKKSWDSRKNRDLGPAWKSKSSYWSFRHVYRLDESKRFKSSQTSVSKLAIVLIWNIQRQDKLSSCERYKIITSKALGTAKHFLIAEREQSIYDSCRFDIGRFRAEPTNYERCLHPSDTSAYRSAHNNLLVTGFWDISSQSFGSVRITKLSPRIESCGHGSECLQRFLTGKLSELLGLLIFCKKFRKFQTYTT